MKTRFRLAIGFIAYILLVQGILLGFSNEKGINQIVPEPPQIETLAKTNPSSSVQTTPELIAAALQRGELDQETADLYLAYALTDYEKLPPIYRSEAPWSGTLPLLDLQERLHRMKTGSRREEIRSLLSGVCGTIFTRAPSESLHVIINTEHFHIDWLPTAPGLGPEAYTSALEATWNTQITRFGWAPPPVLPTSPPPDGRYHVRVEVLPGGLQGFVTTNGIHGGFVGDNPNTPWNDVDAQATCMVLHKAVDFTQTALQVTIAREFNHAIQFGYGARTGTNVPDPIFVDGVATWMEDEVFDSVNANYSRLWPDFTMCMGEYTADPHAYWITWRGLTEGYITGIPGGAEQVWQNFWEEMSRSSTNTMLSALNKALASRGTTLPDAYHAYAIAVKFNKTCGSGYTYPYCFKEGANYVNTAGAPPVHGTIDPVTGSYNGTIADNYALNWISLSTTGPYEEIILENKSSGGQLRGSIVCETDSGLEITPLPAGVGPLATTRLDKYDPRGCASVVAVITNEGQTADNPNSCTAHSYQFTAVAGPNLAASTLTVDPQTATAGQVVTFTARLMNSAPLAATVSLTNTLPSALEFEGIPTASSGNPPALVGSTLTWSGSVTTDNPVTIIFATRLTTETTVFNTIQIDDGLGNIYLRSALINGYNVHLPLLLKDN